MPRAIRDLFGEFWISHDLERCSWKPVHLHVKRFGQRNSGGIISVFSSSNEGDFGHISLDTCLFQANTDSDGTTIFNASSLGQGIITIVNCVFDHGFLADAYSFPMTTAGNAIGVSATTTPIAHSIAAFCGHLDMIKMAGKSRHYFRSSTHAIVIHSNPTEIFGSITVRCCFFTDMAREVNAAAGATHVDGGGIFIYLPYGGASLMDSQFMRCCVFFSSQCASPSGGSCKSGGVNGKHSSHFRDEMRCHAWLLH
jgi:hypothetical protein